MSSQGKGAWTGHAWMWTTDPDPGDELPVTTGLSLWLDADDPSTLSLIDGKVGEWRDRSGSGHAFSQADESVRPMLVTDGQNGRDVVRFGGFQEPLHSTAPHPMVPQPLTVIFAARNTNPAVDGGRIFSSTAFQVIYGAGGEPYSSAGVYAGGADFVLGPIVDTTQFGIGTLILSAGSATAYVDGVPGAPGLAGPNGLSGIMSLGVRNVAAPLPLIGDIGEVIIYDRVLSDAERQQVEQYLTEKWMPPPPPIPTTGLFGWWDADDPTTVTATAGKVSEWRDKSGANRHLSQATAALQPVTGTRSMNGVNALDFTQQLLQSTPIGVTLDHPVTVFCVVQSDAVATSNKQIIGYDDVHGCPLLYASAANQWTAYAGNTVGSPVQVDLAPHVCGLVLNGASSQIRLDGASILDASFGTLGWRADRFILIGNQLTPNEGWDGLIGEVIFYNRILTPAEVTQVEAYLTEKWGIA